MRRAGVAAIALVALSVTSCGSHPWWYTSGESACDQPGLYRVNGEVHTIGECDGNMWPHQPPIALTVGQHVDLHLSQVEPTNAPIDPLPTSSNSSVLRRIDDADGGSTATYVAVAAGTATLTTVNTNCYGKTRPATEPCRVVQVDVTS